MAERATGNQGVESMSKHRKRSSNHRTSPGTPARQAGVGGRQPDPGLPGRGGGYLDVCTSPVSGSAEPDPRLAELREIGIRRTWLRVARVVGFERFLQLWRILSEDPQVQDERGRVYVPSITQYFRYQRNRLILSLAQENRGPDEIQRIVAEQLREQVSEKHIQRIVSSGNN